MEEWKKGRGRPRVQGAGKGNGRKSGRFVSRGSTVEPLVAIAVVESAELLLRPKDVALITLPPLLPLRFIVKQEIYDQEGALSFSAIAIARATHRPA